MLEVSLAGISHAVLHCARTFDEGIPAEGSIRCEFDDSIVTDTAAERRLAMEEVGVTLHPWEYRMRWYGEEESVVWERAAEVGTGAR